MKCIGPGPGPKNVLAEDEAGNRVVVTYATWKHRLSKEDRLSDSPKTWVTVIGSAQQFKDKPVVEQRNANGQTVYGVTVAGVLTHAKSGSVVGGLINLTFWPEYAAVAPHIGEGFAIVAEGSYEARESNGVKYHNVSVTRFAATAAAARAEREVVNAAPVAAAIPAEAAPAPATTSPF